MFQGTLNSGLLIGWFELIINKFPKGSVFVFDNARAHHSYEFLDLIQEAGFMVEFLPPYSPDLNPIEQLWGNIKAKLKLIYDRSLDYVENIIRAIRFYHV